MGTCGVLCRCRGAPRATRRGCARCRIYVSAYVETLSVTSPLLYLTPASRHFPPPSSDHLTIPPSFSTSSTSPYQNPMPGMTCATRSHHQESLVCRTEPDRIAMSFFRSNLTIDLGKYRAEIVKRCMGEISYPKDCISGNLGNLPTCI